MNAYSIVAALQNMILSGYASTFTVVLHKTYSITIDTKVAEVNDHDSSFRVGSTVQIDVTDLTITANDSDFPRAYTLTAGCTTLTIASYVITSVYSLNYTITGTIKTLIVTSNVSSLTYNKGSPVGVTDLSFSDNPSTFIYGKKSVIYLQALSITPGTATFSIGTTYSISCAACTLSLDEKTATFVYNQILIASKEELVLTVNPSTLTKNRAYRLVSSTSTLTLVSWGANLRPGEKTIINGIVCSLAITSYNTTLTAVVKRHYSLVAEVCSSSITGYSATIRKNGIDYISSVQITSLYPETNASTLSRSRSFAVDAFTLSITSYTITSGSGIGIIADTCTLTLTVNDIATTEYVFLVVDPYNFKVNGVCLTLQKDSVYDVLTDYVEVIEDGAIAYYHEVYYSGRNSILVPEDYGVLVHIGDLQQDKNMIERFTRERTDTTENYTNAYRLSMGITLNPYCDVDSRYFHEEANLTADYD